jgi:hypothetical protein
VFAEREAESFLAGLDRPEAVSEQTLLETIIRPNEDSQFGTAHEFSGLKTIRDYQRAVPIRTHEEFRPQIDRIAAGEQGVLTTEPVRRFFLTSGSTSKPKLVPVTSSFLRQKSRAFGIYWSLALEQHPGVERSTIVTNFSDSGEPNKIGGAGLPMSSESAYWSQVTAATQRREKPIIPKVVARISDPEARYYAIARVLLEERFSGIMTLNPSTLLLLFERMSMNREALIRDVERGGTESELRIPDEARAHLREVYPGNPARAAELRSNLRNGGLFAFSAWPSMRLVVSWRSPMLAPYLRLLEPHLEGVGARDYISMASEGVLAIPVEPSVSGGAIASGIHFHEFVPEEESEKSDPVALLPHELELGRKYVVILSTQAGLYRYNIGDVVRVAAFSGRTPVIEFLHRTGNTCSITGEKLTEEQVSGAVARLAERFGLKLTSFTATPAPEGFPRYVLLVELASAVERSVLEELRAGFDRELGVINLEYAAKRGSERLGAPDLWLVAPGGYEARRKRRVAEGTNDPQYKETHLSRDSRFFAQFVISERIDAR